MGRFCKTHLPERAEDEIRAKLDDLANQPDQGGYLAKRLRAELERRASQRRANQQTDETRPELTA